MVCKRIALIAHDARKGDLVAWVGAHLHLLTRHAILATGTTGRKVQETYPILTVALVKSGPLGGDQQIGAMIAEGQIDLLIFFVDPMTAQPHDVDGKALTRLGTLYNVPMACNESTADMIIASPLFTSDYKPRPANVHVYEQRAVP